jgi:hypothetical protein
VRHGLGVVALALSALVLAGCGGGSSSQLTVEDVEPRLESAGIDCTETSSKPLEDGIAATAVTCALGAAGGVVVIIADSADEMAKAKAELCAAAAAEQGELELASGDTWLSVVATTQDVTAEQVADALGGQVQKVADYCAV